jgi:hypothetical protein
MKSFSPLTTSIFEVFSTQHPNLVQIDAFNEYLQIWESFLQKQSMANTGQTSSISSKLKGLFIRARAGVSGTGTADTATLDSITQEGWESFWSEFNTFWQQQSQANANTAEIANINKLKSALRALFTQLQSSQANIASNAYFLALRNGDCSASTLKNYRSDINQFLRFANKSQLSELMAKPKVAEFLENEQTKGLAESSVRRKRTSISLFATWAVQNNWLQSVENLDDLPNPDYKPSAAAVASSTITSTSNSKAEMTPNTEELPAKSALTQEKPKSKPRSAAAALKSGTNGRKTLRTTLRNTLRASNTILPIFNLGLLVLFLMGLTWFGYRQFTLETPEIAAFPAQLTRPSRVLSFQGRLTDTVQNPITSSTNMEFRLYDALTGGTLLWDSGTCSVTPDQDGIFSSGLGDDCGSEIDSDVFSENQAVYLEVQVAAETLTPRQPIRTVAYAINSETLQGYPPADPAVESSVLVLDEFGDLNIGSTSPTINATTGTFTIEGQALVLQTASGTDGDITLSPDGTGGVIINSDLDVQGSVRLGAAGANNVLNTSAAAGAPTGPLYWGDEEIITDASIGSFGVSSVTNADGTLTISPTTGNVIASLNLANDNSWTGEQTFTADTYFPGSGIWNTSGNVGIGTTTLGSYRLNVDGTAYFSGNLDVNSNLTLNTNGIVYGTGISNKSNANNAYLNTAATGLIASRNIADANTAMIIRQNHASSTGDILQLQNSGGSVVNVSQAGDVGIGSTTPSQKLDIAGAIRLGAAGANNVLNTSAAGGPATGPLFWGNEELAYLSDIGTGGVTSVTGTTNEITASPTTGDVILSLPTDLRAPGTFNAETSIATGAGAGTVRIDASGNLTNIGTISASGNATIGGTLEVTNAITATNLSAGGLVMADTGTGELILATAGTDYENPLTFTNGLTRTANSVALGGTLTADTDIALATNDFTFSGTGSVGIGTTTPASLLSVGSTSQFQVNSSGAIAAATGITSSGGITFTGLSSDTQTTALMINGSNQVSTRALGSLAFDNDLAFTDLTDTPGNYTSSSEYLVRVNTAGNGLEFIDPSTVGGVTSVSGTTNQITASPTAGDVVLTLPSDLRAPGTFNAVTSIATGAGAGTVRIDSSGNLTNIGTISASGNATIGGTLEVTNAITATNLSAGGLVMADTGTGELILATAGTDYENPLTFGNGLTRTVNDVALGGTLTGTTDIDLDGNDFTLSGTGNIGIGTTTPSQKLDVQGAIRLGAAGANNVLNTTSTGVGNDPTGPVFWGNEELLTSASLSSYGVSSVTGTANEITTSPTTGDVILSLPSDLRAPGTFNATTSIATGAGAGTVRIDSSGNLTNIGTISASGDITSTGGVISMQGAGDNYFAGNVGIGTTAPSAALSVGTSSQFRVDTSGILSFGTNPATAGQIRLPNNTTMAWRNAANTANTTIGLNSSDNFVVGLGETAPSNIIFNTNDGSNGERMRITGAGNVGIGTSAPNRKLEIVGGADGGNTILAQLRSAFNTDNTSTTLRFANSTSNSAESGAAAITATRTNAATTGDTDLSFRVTEGTTAIEALRILSTGNVGIGSTAPSSKLDVNGDIRLGAAGAYNTFNTTSTGVGNDPTGPVFWGNQEILTDATFSSFGVSSVTGTANEIVSAPTTGAVVLSLPTDMRAPGTFNAETSIATGAGAGTVRIDASGNLTNIGTINSTYLVTSTNVVNLAGANTALQMNSVETITSGRLARMANGSSAAPAYSFSSDPDTGISRPVADTLTFATGGTERARINSTGNMAIGTTSATSRLEVVGEGNTSATSSLNVANLAGSSILFVRNDGRVGIGNNTSPDSILNVNGSNSDISTVSISAPNVSTKPALSLFDIPISTTVNDGKAFEIKATGESFGRAMFYSDGSYGVGSGASSIDVYLSRPSTNTFRISNNRGTGNATLEVTEKIGVGVTAPILNLQVAGQGGFGNSITAANATRALNLNSTDAVMRILRVSADIDIASPGIELLHRTTADGANTQWWDMFADTNGLNLRDRTVSNQTRFTIDNSGDIGIGTTTPSEKLDVSGAIRLGAAGANNVLNTSAAAGAPTGRLYWGDEELAYYSDVTSGGVNTVTGTANQIEAAPTTGDVVLTLPTDLRAPGTFNAETSIATGAGAGTVRIDASGNLLNIEDITSTYFATSTDVVNLVGASTAFQMNGVETITSGRLIRLADGSETTPAYSFTSSDSTGMFSPAADELAFTTDGTEKIRVDASGNVGIGTTAPAAKLDIAGSSSTISNSAGDITIDAASGTISFAGDLITNFLAALGTNGSAAAPTFSFNSDPTSGMFYPGTNGLAFSNNGVERMRFIANGNLGIGTTNPLARFTVEGATVGKALAVFNETGDQDIFTASASGATRFRIDRDGYTHSQRFADLANDDYYLDPAATGTSLTTAGNVGIGITSPLAKLHIQDSTSSTPRGIIIDNIFDGSQGPQLRFRKARGSIGSEAVISNGDVIGAFLFEGYNGSSYASGAQILASAQENWGGSNQGTNLRFFTTDNGTTSQDEKMRISADGNVLIDTTTETARLVVNQTGTDDIIQALDNGTTRFRVEANGYAHAQRFTDTANSTFYLDPAATGDYSLFVAGNIGLNGGGSIKSTGNNNIEINAGTGTVTIGGGTGKLDAGTIDPPYWINGKGYATYMASMIGVKEEITEVVQLQPSGTPGLYTHEINFDELPEGSDMWLFSRISDIDQEMNNLVVLLSGSSNAYTSYVKDVVNRKLIFYGTRPVEISYRLTAPRFDHEKWPTLRNNQDGRGFQPGEYVFGNSGNGQAVTEADLLADLFEQEPISLNTVGTIEITQDASAGFQLERNGVLLELAGAFTQAAIAELRAGLITTQELIAERFVSTPELRTDRIAALTDNTVQIQLNDEEGSELQIIDENLQPVARIDRQGNATFSGTVTAESSLLGELIADEASISGELTAGSIDASSARITQLEARMADVENIKAITAEFTTATVSGTLFANTIHDFDTRVNTALEESSLLNTLLSQVNNDSNTNDTQDVYSSVEMAGYEVTSSNEYDIAFEDLGIADDAFVISPTALFVDEYLRVNNNAFIAGSLGVADQIIVGDGLAIRSGVIEYYSETSNLLEIQPLGGSISLVAGLMTLDENGLVQINGDVFIAGNLAVEGSLLADKLQPADFENPFQIKLATQSATLDEDGNEIDPEFLATQSGEVAGVATESAITKSRFEIVDELGVPVATISAEGRASFRNGISIDPDETATQSGNIVYSNSTAGVATIPTGSSEVEIFSDKITENSLIYVTPLGATNNQVIYVKGKVGQDPDSEIINGMVRVGFQTLSITDVEFNWWIVN